MVVLFPVSEIGLALLRRAKSRIARRADEGSMGLLWLVIAGSLAMAIAAEWVPFARLSLAPSFLRAVALVLLVGGLGVRWLAIVTLGRFFTVDVAIHESHALVERGLYRHVRHPSYTGLLVAFLGVGICFANWLSLLALMLPITFAVLSRIRTEERALLQALGPSYAAYCARTKRLVPGVF
jgi:protein-S-isoprenylcysteine O-methyltransferase